MHRNSSTVLLFLFSLLALGFISFDSFGQHHVCGTDELPSDWESTPSSSWYAHNHLIKNYLAKNHPATQRSAAVDTFDLVIHVFHLGEPIGTGSNLSLAQIESAIVAINRDFSRDTIIHGPITAHPNTVDTEIHFRLACRDENGAPTNGIIRMDGSNISNFSSNGITLGPAGNVQTIRGNSYWDYNKYINIYVGHRVSSQSGAPVGGATIGAGHPNFTQGTAGILMPANYVGCDIDGTLGYNINNYRGSVLSHELGHYIGLYHTFQNGNCSESDCTLEGDLVCDTEPHDGSSQSNCNEFAECTTREPVENIMNYAMPSCQRGFTQRQKDRMKATIATTLSAVVNQGACSTPTSIIQTEASTLDWSVFPNPSSGIIKIHYEPSEQAHYKISNNLGQIIQQGHIEHGDTFISNLGKGLYILSLENKGILSSRKIVVH